MGMATCSSCSSKIILSQVPYPIFNMSKSIVPKPDPYEHLHITPNFDGTITRLLTFPTIEANPEPTSGDSVVCKDLTINTENKTWIRIYRPTRLPSNDNTIARLPIIIYFHAGGFILFSASTKDPHQACSELTSEIPSIVVSLNYRLAPENRLPAQYEDAIDAILWVKQQITDPNGEQWLKDYGDFSRCYVSGRGSGGNIAFHAALRAVDLDLNPLKITGLVLNQPMFGGCERKNSELQFADDSLSPLSVLDLMWDLSLPEDTDRDHPFCNPIVDGPHKMKISWLGRCLVIGFRGDTLFERTQDFISMLVTSGVKVEARFHDTCFNDGDFVDSQWTRTLLNTIKEFVI